MNQRGFTLLELLVVIALTAGVAFASYALIHPKNVDPQLRDAERRSGVAVTMQAINRYYAAKGHLPTSISTREAFIGSGTGNTDLCKDLVPTYISDLPLDPVASAQMSDGKCNADGQTYLTGYYVWRSQDGKTVTVGAAQTETSHAKITLSHAYK